MRGSHRAGLTGGVLALLALAAGCAEDAPPPPSGTGGGPSAGLARAERRAYDGAPPTIPHADPGAACGACHDADGQSVGHRFAPAAPHAGTGAAGATQRCRQCHVFVTTDALFAASGFIGLPQNLRSGGRATPGAPPTIPHRLLMRENCAACHTGPGARDEIRSSHPDRQRCRQCHVPVTDTGEFTSPLDVRPEGG